MQQVRVIYNGATYFFDGKNWLGSDYMLPPTALIPALNQLAADQFAHEDSQTKNFQELMDTATKLRDAGQLDRALNAAQKAMAMQPDAAAPVSVTCSIMRMKRQPQEALAVADNFLRRGRDYLPLLTSRAAALADLERYSEALRQIRHVLALSGEKGTDKAMALAVWSRIKAEAPELF